MYSHLNIKYSSIYPLNVIYSLCTYMYIFPRECFTCLFAWVPPLNAHENRGRSHRGIYWRAMTVWNWACMLKCIIVSRRRFETRHFRCGCVLVMLCIDLSSPVPPFARLLLSSSPRRHAVTFNHSSRDGNMESCGDCNSLQWHHLNFEWNYWWFCIICILCHYCILF